VKGMASFFLIEPTTDLRDSWLAAQREHAEIDGHTEVWGLSIEELESHGSIAGLIESMRFMPDTAPGLASEWWWVEQTDAGERRYIGRVVLRPEPAPYEGHLHVAVRPSRRRQGHGTRALEAALPIAAGRGFLSVVLAVPRRNEAARRLVLRLGATPLAQGPVDRFTLSTSAQVAAR